MMKNLLPRIVLLLISLILRLWLSACREDTITPETFGSVFGEVLVDTDNVPLPGASISTNPPTSTFLTDSAGRFAIENISTGTYTLRVEKEGFNTRLENVAIFDEQTSSVVIRLEPDTLENEAPLIPILVSPANASTDQLVDLTLTWSASDPDEDQLTYEVFLFHANQNQAESIASNLNDTTLQLTGLDYGVTYFWQVEVSDGKEQVLGEVWSFSTQTLPDLRFLYARETNGNYQIFASNQQDITIPLSNGNASAWRPRMSPTRDKVAYLSNEGIEAQLYIANRDGSDPLQLTSIPVAGFNNLELDFCWSPDGSQLLYMNNSRLYLINRDGTGLSEIATAPLGHTFTECDWTANNNLLLARLTGSDPYTSRIFTLDLTGNFQQLVANDDPGGLGGGMFSIDGNAVLYTRDVSGFEAPDGRQLNSRIFIKNLASQSTIDLSVDKPDGTNDLDPRYAPDGASVIFVNTNNDGISPKSIWRVDLDGSNRELLFENAEMPEWR